MSKHPFLERSGSGQQRSTIVVGLLLCMCLVSVSARSQDPTIEEPRESSQGAADQERPAGGTPVADGRDAQGGFFTDLVDVRVINVDVFVSDRSGVPVVGLGLDDFALEVDGAPMPISNFYSEEGGRAREIVGAVESRSDPSFRAVEEVDAEALRRSHVVVLVDHSRLRPNNRKRALRSLREAIGRLGDEELIAVVGVESSLVFYSDFLYDRQATDRILEQVTDVSGRMDANEAERRLIFGELARGQSGGFQARSSTAEEDALLSRIQAYAAEEYGRSIASLRQIEAVISTLAGIPGRKTLLYFGEGIPTRPGEGLYVEWRNRFGGGSPNAEIGIRRFDFNTDYSRSVGRYDLSLPMQALATAANRAGVTIYAVDAEGDHGGDVRSALTEQGATSETLSVVDENYREPMEYVSKATGGRLLRSSGKLTEHLTEAVRDLDSFYSLGFSVPAEWEAGTDHDIQVRLKEKGLLVRHRDEVRLPAADELEAGATRAALRYQAVNNPLGISATPAASGKREDGATVLAVNLEIPIARLSMLPQGDTQAASVSIYVSTRGADGNASPVQKIPFHLAIPNEMMTQAMKDSARYDLPLVLQAGDQQVAIGVRDNTGGVFSAVRLDVAEFAP